MLPLRVLLTGAEGQLGCELLRTTPLSCEVTACGRGELDITDIEGVNRMVARLRPDLIVNTAAYTAVDRAEREPDLAFQINAEGARNVSRASMAHGARLIHVSTDFVFDGERGRPYQPEDIPNPLNIYGASKRRGEEYVLDATDGSALILRTAWLYSGLGRNFVTAMLRRMNDGQALEIVADQVGTPTWAKGLAESIWRAAASSRLQGLHHWTDAGVASWYDFAVAIQEEALACGLLGRPTVIRPINTVDYPTPAKRPRFSVLDKTTTWSGLAIQPLHWRAALRSMLIELGEAEDV
ncbi:MAG: dTDP-4-dehydrorhamnose reductase [Thermoanaerobaculia bacterium]